MRITLPIGRSAFDDEHVIGVDPPLRPELPGVWRRRINPFAGRALSDRALTAEQESRNGLQRLRGQGVTSGVISGLDVMLEPGAKGSMPDAVMIQILPGMGLTQSGEDVTISTPRRIALADLPVFAPVHLLDAVAAQSAAGGMEPDNPAVDGGLRLPHPRRVGPRFKTILAAPAADDFPRVAMLIAEPVTATILGRPRDNCPPDPRDDAYDDLQLIDGVRLILYFCPSEMRSAGPAPDYGLPGPGSDRRNRIAYSIFARERMMDIGDIHPWEALGTPLALFAFQADWTLDFVDRSAVARLGGQPNPRTQLVPASGSSILWHARVAQFSEQLAEMTDVSHAALSAAFRHLPPVGFLPADVVDISTRRQDVFPPGFAVSMAPVAVEHLDVAIGEAASLMPINLDVPDAVELLVPVPERVYEPGLLEIATVDPAFGRVMQRLIADRTNWLIRRDMLRQRRSLLVESATGQRSTHPASDTLSNEALPYPADRGPVSVTRVRRFDTRDGSVFQHCFSGAKSSIGIVQGDRLFLWVRVELGQSLTGISLRFIVDDRNQFDEGRFWGVAAGLPIALNDANIALRQQASLPEPENWTRLELDADAHWGKDGSTLVGKTLRGVEFAQRGGLLEWGPLGKIDQSGNETLWIGDDAPQGASLSSSVDESSWPFAPTGLTETPVEPDFGTVEAGGVRTAIALNMFRQRWQQSFLQDDFIDLEENGIDGFVNAVDARMRATNDVIDLGFVRARADIYRVRQFMLGGDAASRLVTSPALADIAIREEGARAKSADITNFLKTAYVTDFDRDPENPLETSAFKQDDSQSAAAGNGSGGGSGSGNAGGSGNVGGNGSSKLFLNGFALSRFATTTSGETRPARGLVNVRQPEPPGRGTTVPSGPGRFVSQSDSFSVAGRVAALRFDRAVSVRDVQAQQALPGAVERTVSVAERLKGAPAVEAYNYAMAGKFEVMNAIARLLTKSGRRAQGIALADLPAPGFKLKAGLPPPAASRQLNTIGDVINDRDTRTTDKREYIDIDERTINAKNHEADYFTSAVGAIDNSIALMRLVEGRVDLYRKLLDDARNVRDALLADVGRLDARMRTINVEIEEARHDVNVAEALLAEETARVAELNAKRKAIIDAHVTALLFRRPRAAEPTHIIPVTQASGGYAESPIAICLREHDSVPEELRDYVGLFRDAPVRWFPAIHAQLALIDRLDAARAALIGVRARAANPVAIAREPDEHAPRHLAAVHYAHQAQRSIIDERRNRALGLDFTQSAGAELAQVHLALGEHASLSDIMAGDHSRPALSRHVANALDSMAQVAGCLHASLGETPPKARLDWAESLSEFDQSAPLSRLSGLSGWNALPLELRRTQQGFVDWLFAQIDRKNLQAVGAVNELVRICILLAAHAPVERLIPAQLVAPTPARVGGRLELAANVRLARIGMMVLLRGRDNRLIAHAVVDDLADGLVRARIVRVFLNVTTIGADVHVELSDRRVN